MSSTQISPMTLKDIREVKKIEVENNLSHWSEADYANEIERIDSIALIAKTSKKAIGFFVARLIMKEADKADVDNFQGEIEIYNLAVEKQFHRKGIGRKLLSECFKRGKLGQIGRIWLEVRESNFGAIEFYKTHGFEVIYQRKNFYHTPIEDALVLSLEL